MTLLHGSPTGLSSDGPTTSWREALAANKWVRFSLRRGGQFALAIWVLITASFLMIHLIPGDPVRAALGITAPPELVEATRDALGLNDPLLTQYFDYLGGLIGGDLGVSLISGLPVFDVIGQRLPATLSIAVPAFLLAVSIAVPLGVAMSALTRRGRGRRSELVFTSTSVVVGTIPDIIVGIILVYLFSVNLQWLPVAGRAGPASYVLPVASLAIGPALVLARIVRVEMLSVLEADYIRTARAKRLGPIRVFLVHALPNAITASLTIGGLLLGSLVAGTVLVENVFAWPGLGTTIVNSILTKDYPLAQGTVLVYGTIVLAINLGVDIVLALIDPRSMINES
jgi:peptide/nickel transport system permease protein